MISIKLSGVMIPSFNGLHKRIRQGSHMRYVLKGGRASGKSSVIAQEIVLDIVRNPITALCVRKVGNTLQESCYEQIKEAIDQLGLGAYFKTNVSPLKITYIPRGNSIIFRGADDPAKIKSIKMSRFPIARLWIEELAEFKTEDEVSMIENSVLRGKLEGGLDYKLYYSYNPPKRKQSWVNKRYETAFVPENTYVHHSDYRSNPFISDAFTDEAEHIAKVKPAKYRWEYLGEPIGSGVVPFDNLEFEQISDDAIADFDNIRQGIDWGYANDPFAFVRLHYDKTRRRIYVFDEIYEVKLSNREAYRKIDAMGYTDAKILADSAEPKSVDEMRSYGLKIEGARKGPGSVEYGEKWLDDLEAIVIDPKRCPNTAREFEAIDYEVDRDGNAKNKLEDKDNHTIDAVRYSMAEDMRGDLFSFD